MTVDPIKDILTRPDGVAARLRRLREQSGVTGDVIATSAGWQRSKVSKLENGRQRPSHEDVRHWVQAVGAPPEAADEIIAMLDEAREEHLSWRRKMSRGQAVVQADYWELVAASTRFREFILTAVPGLLQTPDYARAVFQEMVDLHELEDRDVEAATVQRLRRQQFLYDPAHQFEFLLGESALRYLIVQPDVMRGQLDRLQTIIGAPNVRFGILPMGVKLSAMPHNEVVLLVGESGTVAQVETSVGQTTSFGEDAEKYMRVLDRMWPDAAEGEDARALILAARDALPT